MSNWCVYFIRCGKKDKDPVKIGMTSNVQKRLIELQIANPYELELLFTLPCESELHADKLETFIHNQINSHYHFRGEWYDIRRINLPKIMEKFNRMYGTVFGLK